MKKVVASVCIAAGLLLPSTAGASQLRPIARVIDCPPGYSGYVVQTWNEKRGWYDVAAYCKPVDP